MVYILIICTLVWIDLYIKKIVKEKLKDKRSQKLFGRFYLFLVYNKGAAYGLLKKSPIVLKIFITIALMMLFFILFIGVTQQYDLRFNLSLSFIIGGALGNFIDRLKHGAVTDYIYIKLKYFPVFNLADIFIFLPSVFLIIVTF